VRTVRLERRLVDMDTTFLVTRAAAYALMLLQFWSAPVITSDAA